MVLEGFHAVKHALRFAPGLVLDVRVRVRDAARALAQRLAAGAQGIECRDLPRPPAWREVPRLADHAAGDQVAVTGQDLLDAIQAVDPDYEVWTPTGRRSAREVAEELLAALGELRRTL